MSDKNQIIENLIQCLNQRRIKMGHPEVSDVNFRGHNLEDAKRDVPFQIFDGLNQQNTQKLFQNMNINEEKMVSSSPSLCWINEKEILVNVRFVNYKINEKGEYINKDTIKTVNAMTIYDIDSLEIKKQFIMNYNEKYDNVYVGLEDVRLMNYNNKIHYTSNRGLKMGNMEVEYGIIDLENPNKVQSTLMKIKNQSQIEKNWVLFENSEKQLKMIYKWYPLTIGEIVQVTGTEMEATSNELSPISKMVVTHEIETPHFFKWLRGSTNGITIGDEIYFLCHLVSYEDRRYYYHCMVVLDNKTMKLKKYSKLFTFKKSPVEYTLGMIHIEDTLLIGYSVMDKETKFITMKLTDFDFC